MYKDTDQHIFNIVKQYDNALMQSSKFNHFSRTAFKWQIERCEISNKSYIFKQFNLNIL